jgi:hypothetical protein
LKPRAEFTIFAAARRVEFVMIGFFAGASRDRVAAAF